MGASDVRVRTYTGENQPEAAAMYGADALVMAAEGWVATTQEWVEGNWTRREYVIAALLILVGGIGLVLLIGMVFVKPKRTQMVTFRRAPAQVGGA